VKSRPALGADLQELTGAVRVQWGADGFGLLGWVFALIGSWASKEDCTLSLNGEQVTLTSPTRGRLTVTGLVVTRDAGGRLAARGKAGGERFTARKA
jgi:hypothetical protein